MGYVAAFGGERAIASAEKLSRYLRVKGGSPPLSLEQIQDQLGLLVDRVMGEGSLYAPRHAALALKQAEGDTMEAAFYLRAYRSTLKRLPDSLPMDTGEMRIERRISSAFKDIPGGQLLGPTPDYRQRTLDFSLQGETTEDAESFVREFEKEIAGKEHGGRIPGDAAALNPGFAKREASGEAPSRVIELLRRQGLVPPLPATAAGSTEGKDRGETPARPEPADITRESLAFPASRSARLQALARGETGGMLSLAYSSMRGFGNIHPTIAELRVGWVPIRIRHPHRAGERVTIGSVRVTEAEVLAAVHRGDDGDTPRFSLGYGICFGRNEVKAISMAVLDRTMKSEEPRAPAEDEEFVLLHTDGIEASGFCSHFKLPHYVTFQSALDRLRESQRLSESPRSAGQGVAEPERGTREPGSAHA